MNPTTRRISKVLASICVAAAIVTPTASAVVDIRSPDGTDGAVMKAAPPYQDLRSPDAQDAAVNTQSGSYTPAPSDSSSDTDWGSIGLITGSVLMLGLFGFGMFAVSRRRRPKSRVPAISS